MDILKKNVIQPFIRKYGAFSLLSQLYAGIIAITIRFHRLTALCFVLLADLG